MSRHEEEILKAQIKVRDEVIKELLAIIIELHVVMIAGNTRARQIIEQLGSDPTNLDGVETVRMWHKI